LYQFLLFFLYIYQNRVWYNHFFHKSFYPKKKLFWGFIRKIIQMATKRFNFLKEKFRDIVRQYKLYPNSLEVFV